MTQDVADILTAEQLHAYVHAELCDRENLLDEMFATRVTILRRGDDVCGLQFHLQGPRCIKLGAVWAADSNVVYFYDTRGSRYRKDQLVHRLAIETAAA